MCTSVSFNTKNHYFGRNLDYHLSYGEQIVVMPRSFPLNFRKSPAISSHYAIIGMAAIFDGCPLFFDGANERGLAMAGLLFSGYAHYYEVKPRYDNITPFEFIPWVLSQCKNVSEAKELLKGTNIVDIPFSSSLPLSPLHWMISDKNESIVVESVKDGIFIYDNSANILTNNPPFPIQLFNLRNYMNLSPNPPKNSFSQRLSLSPYSLGMGALGLPGDLSSSSRFIRGAFTLHNSVSGESEEESVNQFFHILGSCAQQRGCVYTQKGEMEITLYSSCINTDKGIYYYTTYNNSSVSAVDMHRENLDSDTLKTFPLQKEWTVMIQN